MLQDQSRQYSDRSRVPISHELDPRVSINIPKEYSFQTSGSFLTHKSIQANTASQTQCNWNYQANSSNLICTDAVGVLYQLIINLTGTSPTGYNLIQPGFSDAVRSWPLQSSCTTTDLQINNATIPFSNMNEILQALLRYDSFDVGQRWYSPSMGYLDTTQSYNDFLSLGFNVNPLGQYGQQRNLTPRGEVLQYQVLSNTPTSAQVRITIFEPLLVSPLVWGDRVGPSFCLMNNLQLRMTYNLSKVWSHSTAANGTTITAVSASIDTASGPSFFNPYLLFIEINPDMSIPSQIPNHKGEYNYPYQQMLWQNPTVISSLASGAASTTLVNNISLGTVPKGILVYAKQIVGDQLSMTSPNYFAVTSPDVFQYISNIGISVNSGALQLSNLTEVEYYNIALRNGYKGSFQDWKYHSGSPLLLNVGNDFVLPPGVVPGSTQAFNFQINQITVKNISPVTMNIEICVLLIYDGVFSIQDSTAAPYSGLLSPESAILAPIRPVSHLLQSKYGTGFFSDLYNSVVKPAANAVYDVGKTAYEVGKKVLPVARIASNFVPGLGPVVSALGGKLKKKKGKGLSGNMSLYGGSIDKSREVGYMDQEEMLNKMQNLGRNREESEDEEN